MGVDIVLAQLHGIRLQWRCFPHIRWFLATGKLIKTKTDIAIFLELVVFREHVSSIQAIYTESKVSSQFVDTVPQT